MSTLVLYEWTKCQIVFPVEMIKTEGRSSPDGTIVNEHVFARRSWVRPIPSARSNSKKHRTVRIIYTYVHVIDIRIGLSHWANPHTLIHTRDSVLDLCSDSRKRTWTRLIPTHSATLIYVIHAKGIERSRPSTTDADDELYVIMAWYLPRTRKIVGDTVEAVV